MKILWSKWFNNYKRTRYFCKNSEQSEVITNRKTKLVARCMFCKGEIVRGGFYNTNAHPRKRRRVKCKDCNRHYNIKRKYLYRKLDRLKLQKILMLWRKPKIFTSKYDSYKKLTYSTRDIAKMLEVSKSGVHKIVSDLI